MQKTPDVATVFDPMNVTVNDLTHDLLENYFFLSSKALQTKVPTRKKPLRYVLLDECQMIGSGSYLQGTDMVMPSNFAIYTTESDDLFSHYPANRPRVPRYIKRLAESMSVLFGITIIIVNEELVICDGQNREEAIRSKGGRVVFWIIPGLTIEYVRHINQHAQNWKDLQRIDSYAHDNENYKRLKDFMDQDGYSHNLRSTIAFLFGERNNKAIKSIKDGKFVLEEYQVTYGMERLKKFNDLAKKHPKGKNRTDFVLACVHFITFGCPKDKDRIKHEEKLSAFEKEIATANFTEQKMIKQRKETYLKNYQKKWNKKRPYDHSHMLTAFENKKGNKDVELIKAKLFDESVLARTTYLKDLQTIYNKAFAKKTQKVRFYDDL